MHYLSVLQTVFLLIIQWHYSRNDDSQSLTQGQANFNNFGYDQEKEEEEKK